MRNYLRHQYLKLHVLYYLQLLTFRSISRSNFAQLRRMKLRLKSLGGGELREQHRGHRQG